MQTARTHKPPPLWWHAYPLRLWRQPVPHQAHRVGQGHGMGRWWEPAAISTCTSLLTTPTGFCELQKLGDIVGIIEIKVQKGLPGLLPRPGTLSPSSLFILVGLLLHMSTTPSATASSGSLGTGPRRPTSGSCRTAGPLTGCKRVSARADCLETRVIARVGRRSMTCSKCTPQLTASRNMIRIGRVLFKSN